MPNGCKCSECELRAECPRLKQLIDSGALAAAPPPQTVSAESDIKRAAPTAEDWEDFWYNFNDPYSPDHSQR